VEMREEKVDRRRVDIMSVKEEGGGIKLGR
jgi:hypothetical protein